MKKNLLILSLIAVALVSCKEKNEQAEALSVEHTAEDHSGHSHATDEVAQVASNAPLTSLALSENYYDFKDVKKGESVEHIYEVTNTGENPLIISEVKPACGCTAPNYTKEPIMPGEKGQITLKFDSSNFDGMQTKQAEVFANVEKSPIVLTFMANVVN
ncbi:MAG: DUF1573 domain-containing protein [Cruoricaptor ignavus]|nr:DUF1573 domain-containing protein [Cruoricaptor ignavus]